MKILKDNWFSDFLFNLGLFKKEIIKNREQMREKDFDIFEFTEWFEKNMQDFKSTGIPIDVGRQSTANQILIK